MLPTPLPLQNVDDDTAPPTDRPLRRRRIRKRKRRPTTTPPNTPDELWQEMQEESLLHTRPNNRRRITPNYHLHQLHEDDVVKVKVRDPFTALKEEDEKLKKLKVESTTVPLKVKEVLKETTERKVSLSEVLQRKNLSLSELLKGDPQVLSALIENSNSISRNYESEEVVDLQKVKPESQNEVIMDRMSLKPKLRPEPNKDSTSGPVRITIDLESALAHEQLPEKLKNATAKEELMEILKDPEGSERLARILASRNMTLEELIQQRERGSSQLHLSDIFHSEKREPVPKEKPLIGKIIVFPTVKVVPLPSSKARSLKHEPEYTVTSFPTYKIEMQKPDAPPQFFPIHESDSETTTDYNNLQPYEDIENRLVEAANERLNIEIPDVPITTIHHGVKSAILASAIIVGASLSVFLTIFVVFKWTQKQKRRLNYCDSFTRIRAPILMEVERNKRSLRAFMTETLGRRKGQHQPFYQQNLQQSMSDVSWESDRKWNRGVLFGLFVCAIRIYLCVICVFIVVSLKFFFYDKKFF